MNPAEQRHAYVYLGAIFVVGVLTGVALGWGISRRASLPTPEPEPVRETLCHRLEHRLGVTPVQLESVKPQIDRATEEIQEVTEQVNGIVDRLQQEVATELAAPRAAGHCESSGERAVRNERRATNTCNGSERPRGRRTP